MCRALLACWVTPLASWTPSSIKRLVQHAHRQLGVLGVDHHRHLDLRRRDHLDVDALARQHLEHARRDAGVAAHAEPDDRHLGHRRCPTSRRRAPISFATACTMPSAFW